MVAADRVVGVLTLTVFETGGLVRETHRTLSVTAALVAEPAVLVAATLKEDMSSVGAVAGVA